MGRGRHWLGSAVVLFALASLLVGVSEAKASVANCAPYVPRDRPVDVQAAPTVRLCIAVWPGWPTTLHAGNWAMVGVFITPSATTITTTPYGTTTVNIAGGVCVSSPYWWGDVTCVHDPTITVDAAAYRIDPAYGTGAIAGAKVRPCVTENTPWNAPDGVVLGAACVSTGGNVLAETTPAWSTTATVQKGFCVTWGSTTCVSIHSYTNVQVDESEQQECVKADSGLLCVGVEVTCETMFTRSASPEPGPLPADCDATPTS